jgi:hypothetical protein
MASQIVRLRGFRVQPPAQPEVLDVAPKPPARVEVWSGGSGQRYGHDVYSLIACPPLPRASYLLVHREPDGRWTVLDVAPALNDAPTLNLAQIRQHGALLGANEVHVHVPAPGAGPCQAAIAEDLRAVLLGEPREASGVSQV